MKGWDTKKILIAQVQENCLCLVEVKLYDTQKSVESSQIYLKNVSDTKETQKCSEVLTLKAP